MLPVEIIEKYDECTPLGPVLLSREEWQTLKAAVLAQQTTNSRVMPCDAKGCPNKATIHVCGAHFDGVG